MFTAFVIFGVTIAALAIWVVVRVINHPDRFTVKVAISCGVALAIVSLATGFEMHRYREAQRRLQLQFLRKISPRRPTPNIDPTLERAHRDE
jgi:hypothetical protein